MFILYVFFLVMKINKGITIVEYLLVVVMLGMIVAAILP